MRKVLIAQNLFGKAGSDKLSGILRYLHKKPQGHWEIKLVRGDCALPSDQVLRGLFRSGLDGVILSHMPLAERTISGLVNSRVPTVAMEIPVRHPLRARRAVIRFLTCDSRRIGAAAADYFLGLREFAAYGYVGDSRDYVWSRHRGEAFAKVLSGRGFRVSVHTPDAREDRKGLAAFLRSLSKPAALFVAYDDMAAEVLSVCREYGVRVPDEVCVLGVNDDDFICRTADPTLSSVRPDFETEGFDAAAMLDALMSGEGDCEPRERFFGAAKVTERESTRIAGDSDGLVRRALEYIEANATRGIFVDDVVRHLNVSRRLADLRFRETGGRTILEEINVRRLAAVKRLLRESDFTCAEIAARCGFSNFNSLRNFFRRQTGGSMCAYRAEKTKTKRRRAK